MITLNPILNSQTGKYECEFISAAVTVLQAAFPETLEHKRSSVAVYARISSDFDYSLVKLYPSVSCNTLVVLPLQPGMMCKVVFEHDPQLCGIIVSSSSDVTRDDVAALSHSLASAMQRLEEQEDINDKQQKQIDENKSVNDQQQEHIDDIEYAEKSEVLGFFDK